MSTLLDRIDGMLSEDPLSRVRLRVPQKEGKMLALLEAVRASNRVNTKAGWWVGSRAPESVVMEVEGVGGVEVAAAISIHNQPCTAPSSRRLCTQHKWMVFAEVRLSPAWR